MYFSAQKILGGILARKKRIIHKECDYHIMLQGVGGQTIFEDDEDRSRFCLLLQYASQLSRFSIHGFCLMNNHVHLLLQPHHEQLASGMHSLAFRYAQYFNKKNKREGHLFRGRYKSILVQNEDYLRRVIRYIHNSPSRLGLEEDLSLSTNAWNSYRAYTGELEFTWLKKERILRLFDCDLEAFQKYTRSKDREVEKDAEEIRNSIKSGAYGDPLFIEEFQRQPKGPFIRKNDPEGRVKISWDILGGVLKEVTTVSFEEIQSSCRRREIVDARSLFVSLGLRFKLGRPSELATVLQRDPTSIARLEQRTQKSPELLQFVDEISMILGLG